MISGSFQNNFTKYSFTNHTFNIYMHKQDLALNNRNGLICLKTNKPTNQPTKHC